MAFDGPNLKPVPAGLGEASPDAGPGMPGAPASEAPTRRDRPTPPVATSATPPAPPLGAFAKYELLERLGQGGMGVIFRARDTALDREVALKKIRSGVWAHAEEVERFRTEARAIARLRNPHIVQVYDVNEYDGQHYFTMQFAPGGSVAEHLNRFTADPRRTVDLMRKVARAVHCVHRENLLHRDLKPSNLLLDDGGEPLVSDFGLAKFLDVDSALTRPGVPVGTPAYMSPEQTAGQTALIGVRSDVWALGVILYELLTGQKPFRHALGEGDLVRAICFQKPFRPRALQPALDRDLEMIVLTCLEKDPADRYQTAEALARDLDRWLDGEAPTARPVGWPMRVARRVRRKAGWVAAVALAAAACALLGQALVVFGPLGPGPSPQQQDRQQRLAYLGGIQRDLAAARQVTLVGATGPEKPYPFRLEPLTGVVKINPGAVLALESQDVLLLPLVPDPGVNAYRLEAEVLHGQLNPSPVGLFVGYDDQPTPQGRERCYCMFGCVVTPAHQAREGVARPTLVTLRLCGHLEKGSPPRPHLFFYGSSLLRAAPPPAGALHWCKLALEVRPGEVRAFWEDEPLHPLGVANLACAARDLVDYQKFLRPGPFVFTARGALGLYVNKNRGEFRNVILKPLPAR
jgi:hypothetical protein